MNFFVKYEKNLFGHNNFIYIYINNKINIRNIY